MSRSDNETMQGQQVWAIGKPGIYGIDDGVPEHVEPLFVDDGGTLWAVGHAGMRGRDGAVQRITPVSIPE